MAHARPGDGRLWWCLTCFGLLLVCINTTAPISSAPPQAAGLRRGALVIAGGGDRLREAGILQRFLTLAGGPDAPIVVIPTAGESAAYDSTWPGLSPLRDAGATSITLLHTTSRTVADTEAFVAPLLAARAVWIPGGRSWRLADSYLNTRTHHELKALLDRGGVVGGTSAGASILGSFVVRGDAKDTSLMVGDRVDGFGLLQSVAIDQHLLRRNRHFDLVDVIRARPQLLGIGVDENTALVVRGDWFEIVGESYVAIYDYTRRLDTGGEFYFLAPGDRYNLRSREAERSAAGSAPLDRVRRRTWK
jgi:cyanophycinase